MTKHTKTEEYTTTETVEDNLKLIGVTCNSDELRQITEFVRHYNELMLDVFSPFK